MTEARRVDLVIPGGLDARTGGFIYDRTVVEQLRDRNWRVDVHGLDPSFPRPTAEALGDAAARLAGIPDRRRVIIDGLVLGAIPAIVERHARRLCQLGLVHHPLAEETGLAADVQAALRQSERRALAAVSAVVVTSPFTARALGDYGVEPGRITVVRPGTDPAPLAAGGDGTLQLLCVATLTARKGHLLLIEALADLRDRDWHLRCAGSTDRDPETTSAVRRRIAELGLEARVSLLGELRQSALGRQFHEADAFVLASHYEGYGMAFAEALARGLPIVATSGGAVPETVPPDAALLVPPGDTRALRGALARLLDDTALRAALRAGARRARRRLPTWQDTGDAFDELLGRLPPP